MALLQFQHYFNQLPQHLYDTSSSHCQIYYTRVWTRQIYSVLHHHCVFITLNCLKHQRFFTESALRSSYPIPRCRYYCTRVWIHLIFCYYITIASPSRYSVSSIDDSSQSRFYNRLILFLIA
ncbi:hypothetical protein HID58_095072 [Brassica napus]|uniref:Uncharacterized protein n=1 Tax=Brassica napus TaxID=3708 RepID=A0ABQ7X4Y7_BRANA|nr:hypothetical protein HID58_095072 [Brassica napus]